MRVRKTAQGDTLHGGDTRPKINFFLWLNLEGTLDKRRGKMRVVRRRHHFQRR